MRLMNVFMLVAELPDRDPIALNGIVEVRVEKIWCLFGVYYERAPERIWRIRETKEKFNRGPENAANSQILQISEQI